MGCYVVKKAQQMGKKTSSKDFLKGYEQIWKSGPTVKYNNPDAWSQASGN
jgi:hypothetical protein